MAHILFFRILGHVWKIPKIGKILYKASVLSKSNSIFGFLGSENIHGWIFRALSCSSQKIFKKTLSRKCRPGDTSGNLFPNKKCSKSESAWSWVLKFSGFLSLYSAYLYNNYTRFVEVGYQPWMITPLRLPRERYNQYPTPLKMLIELLN